MKPKAILGLIFMLIGVGIIVYAFLLWNSNFQLSKATNPNFVINSMVVSIEYIVLIIVGILAFIGGGLIINKNKTLRMLGILYTRLNRK